jgi:uncharacterized membrane protein YidH (DUF202 family)
MDDLLKNIGREIVNPAIILMVAVAVVVFIYGVAEFIAAADNEEKRSKGRQHIIWGIIGLFIMVSVWGVMNILNNFWSNLD